MFASAFNAIGKRLVTFVLLGSALQGCSTTQVHSTVNDSHAAQFSGAVVIRPESWRPESERRGWGGVEFEYEHQSGSGTQNLQTDEYVEYVPYTQLLGPQTISHQASVDHEHIGYNRLWIFNRHFQLEPSISVSHDEISIETSGQVSGTSATTSMKQSITGIALQVVPRWYFNRFVGVEVPVRFSIGYASRGESLSFLSGHNNGTTIMFTPSLVFSPVRNVAFSIGYVDREQSVETDLDQSNIDLSFSGVNAAIKVTF